MAEPVAQTSPPDIETEVFSPMCCSVCGRQDETLRDSIFPWVASALLVTTRRTFVGRWCGRHRRVQLGLAALITSTVGWLGVPWGVIHTPLTLIKLAGGGEDLSEENARLLKDLAHYKQRSGDKEGALACLEESLKLADSPEARDEESLSWPRRWDRRHQRQGGRLLGLSCRSSSLRRLSVAALACSVRWPPRPSPRWASPGHFGQGSCARCPWR